MQKKNIWITAAQRDKLKKVLKKTGFRQYQLARKLKFGPQYFSQFLNGWYPMNGELWNEIEKALGKRKGYFTKGK